MKTYSNEAFFLRFFATHFYDKGMPKAGFNHTCLAVISLDSTLRKDENYFL